VGRFTRITDAPPLLWGSAAATIVLHVGYILRHTLTPVKRTPAFAGFDAGPDGDSSEDPDQHQPALALSRRIKVMTDYDTYPLWAMDEGLVGDFAPGALGVSLELENDLWSWAGEFDMSLNRDDPADSHWSEARHRQHIEEGLSLARRIKSELPEREVYALNTEGDLIEIMDRDQAAGLT
jgi:hypothetical protein